MRRIQTQDFTMRLAGVAKVGWKNFFNQTLDEFGKTKRAAFISLVDKELELRDRAIADAQRARRDKTSRIAKVTLLYEIDRSGEKEEPRNLVLWIPEFNQSELTRAQFSAEFDQYLKTQIYDHLTAIGATSIGVSVAYLNEKTKDFEHRALTTERFIIWLKRSFLVKSKPLHVSHLAPRLAVVYNKPLEIYAMDAAKVREVEDKQAATETEIAQRQERLRVRFDEVAKLEGLNVGIDAGGTDIKLVVFEDGNIIFEKEHNWDPKEFSTTALHLEAIEYMVRVGAIAAKIKGMPEGEEKDAEKAELDEIENSNNTIETLREYVERKEKDFGLDEIEDRGIRSIGISWPDTVIANKVLAGANKTQNVGVFDAVKEIAKKAGLNIDELSLPDLTKDDFEDDKRFDEFVDMIASDKNNPLYRMLTFETREFLRIYGDYDAILEKLKENEEYFFYTYIPRKFKDLLKTMFDEDNEEPIDDKEIEKLKEIIEKSMRKLMRDALNKLLEKPELYDAFDKYFDEHKAKSLVSTLIGADSKALALRNKLPAISLLCLLKLL